MKSKIVKLLIVSLLAVSATVALSACGDKEEKQETTNIETKATEEAEVEQDFIVVGSENGEPLIFYNLNMVTSVEDLEEYVDITYDFENKPELLLGQVEAPEGVFEQIMEMLDEKGVVYSIIEDTE